MKNWIKAIRLTLVFSVFLSVSYILVLWLLAKVAGPNGGIVELVEDKGKPVGAVCVGQSFSSERYFWSRPSCAGDGYDAANSCGSNKGPTNPEYLAEVEARIDTFLVHHPYLNRADVPAEMVTASGSGLDPNISPKAALVQVERVAKVRGLDMNTVQELVAQHTEEPLAGVFGTSKVNVLKLNLALDNISK